MAEHTSEENPASSEFEGPAISFEETDDSVNAESANATNAESENAANAESVNAVPVPQQVKPEKKEKKASKQRPIPIPKDSQSFFRARAKDPKTFAFTSDGNLQVPEMRGQAAKVIELPRYRQATISEISEGESKRADELVHIEKEYDETLRSLKEAMEIWRTTGASSDAIKFQRELTRLDNVRSVLRSPLRWIKEYKNVSVREILTDEFYRVKKIGYTINSLRQRSYPFDEFVKIRGPMENTEVAEVEVEAEPEPEEETFIFFSNPSDPEHGMLSPDTLVEFVFNSTKYNSLTQAYEVERVTQLGRRKDLGPLLLKSRSPTYIRTLATKITGEVEKPRELWIDIIKALLSQYPKYADILRKTGTDTLVYANPSEGRWGIGLSADNEEAMDRNQWKGKNILGEAWQVVRSSLPEEETDAEEEDAVQQGGYTEHGKTLKESKEQRSNVLKGYYRKMKSFS